jgi:hypothetical protein
MVYYLCACGYLTYIYKFTSVLNNYQQRISGIIAKDDNLVKSDAKKMPTSISSAVAREGHMAIEN